YDQADRLTGVSSGGASQAGYAYDGDGLRTEHGADLTVSAIQHHMGSAHVYTLTIAKDHTFLVGDGVPVLVHNCDVPPSQLSLFSQDELDRVGAGNMARDTGTARTYQTYTKINPDTGQIYVGRTSGFGSPQENVARRDSNHEYTSRGFRIAIPDKS